MKRKCIYVLPTVLFYLIVISLFLLFPSRRALGVGGISCDPPETIHNSYPNCDCESYCFGELSPAGDRTFYMHINCSSGGCSGSTTCNTTACAGGNAGCRTDLG